jgi:UDP-N-acetylmuramoylalanine--D-glutamate ligase
MRIADLAGRRLAVWGFGREGRAALAALQLRLPRQPVTLFCNVAEAPFGQAMHPAVEVDTGAPSAGALSVFDVVIKSPGIGAYRPELLEAQHNGTHFTSGTALWFAENPAARVIAVTGTKGKSTVTALIAHLLRSLGRRVALAGNIGLPLLELLDPPQAPDWWVVELSSFQTREAGPLEVGVINNVDLARGRLFALMGDTDRARKVLQSALEQAEATSGVPTARRCERELSRLP